VVLSQMTGLILAAKDSGGSFLVTPGLGLM